MRLSRGRYLGIAVRLHWVGLAFLAGMAGLLGWMAYGSDNRDRLDDLRGLIFLVLPTLLLSTIALLTGLKLLRSESPRLSRLHVATAIPTIFALGVSLLFGNVLVIPAIAAMTMALSRPRWTVGSQGLQGLGVGSAP